MQTEVEARFLAHRPDRLARLASVASLGGVELGPSRTVEEVDRYLDTDARTLATAGWACRLRIRDGHVTVSLKGPAAVAPSGRGIHRRPEIEGPATPSDDPDRWPPGAAHDLVDHLRAGEPLRELVTLRQVRTERTVATRGSAFATLSLDTVSVDVGGVRRGGFHVVEVELAADAADREADLDDMARALAAEPGLAPDRLTKLERALQLIEDP